MSLVHTGDAVIAQTPSVRAAEYVRMSTEHQQYSTENQRDRIRDYAAHRGLNIFGHERRWRSSILGHWEGHLAP